MTPPSIDERPSGDASTADPPVPAPPNIRDLFLICLKIGTLSFGGAVVVWLNHELVKRRSWLSESDFLKDLSAARMLPGTTAANITAFVGYRVHGLAGAFSGLAGLLIGPLLITMLIAYSYDQVKGPIFDGTLEGAAAAAIGPFAYLAVKSIKAVGWKWYALAVMAACAGVAVAGYPLVAIVTCGIAISFALVRRFGGHDE